MTSTPYNEKEAWNIYNMYMTEYQEGQPHYSYTTSDCLTEDSTIQKVINKKEYPMKTLFNVLAAGLDGNILLDTKTVAEDSDEAKLKPKDVTVITKKIYGVKARKEVEAAKLIKGISMVTKTPVICNKCERDTGMYYENFSHYVLTKDIKCPYCQSIIIKATRILY